MDLPLRPGDDIRWFTGPSRACSWSGFAFVESLLPDGTAVCTWRAFDRDGGPPAEGEVSRDTLSVQVLAAAGDMVHELGRFPGDETVVLQSGEVEGGFSITISSTAFGRSTQIAGGASGVWVGDTDHFEIRRYSVDGRLEALVKPAG